MKQNSSYIFGPDKPIVSVASEFAPVDLKTESIMGK